MSFVFCNAVSSHTPRSACVAVREYSDSNALSARIGRSGRGPKIEPILMNNVCVVISVAFSVFCMYFGIVHLIQIDNERRTNIFYDPSLINSSLDIMCVMKCVWKKEFDEMK